MRRPWGVTLVLALGFGTAACSSGAPAGAPATTSSTTPAALRVPVSTSSTTTTTAAPTSTSTSTPAPGAQPTLGVTGAFGPAGVGFGQVRPSEISLGGDPTGILTGISWQTWGGSQATGTGTSTYVASGQTVVQGTLETATAVAFDLGTCRGAAAYQQVTWYFPQHGQTPSDNGSSPANACTGP
jgi:hypothetical protein